MAEGEKVMDRAYRLAERPAKVLEGDAVGVWRIADTGVAGFGAEVPQSRMSGEDESAVMVGADALVRGLDKGLQCLKALLGGK